MNVNALNAKYAHRPKSGMIVKDQIVLQPAQYYYRFAHSMVKGQRQTRDQIIGGAWWIDADVFNTIKNRAERSESHLSSAARRNLAIAKRWEGKVDIVVRALLVGPLLAYIGPGTYQVFEDSVPDDLSIWIPSPDAIQIYIPGLREKNPTTGSPIYRDAFAHAEQIRIGWDPTC
ncbi:hypothetical protein PQR71_19415 [Paraburkholderia fungorum]|uniref:hypothetical protein n=1 Tax=Paraburkholderia fungorum TaxID=134537 RepID=UPI0038BCCE7B